MKFSGQSVQWVLTCSMWMDRQTDTMKLTVAYRSFADAPNKDTIFHIDHNWSLELSKQRPRESHFNIYVHSR